MSRKSLLVVGVVACAALLVSTGAYPLSGGTDEVAGADVELSPAEGPNGDYALLDADGEIALRLTGANPDVGGGGVPADTRTPIDRVFTVTNVGDTEAAVWITDDADAVRFYHGDDPDDGLEGSANEVTVDPNETLSVGLLVDTRGEHDVEQASEFSVRVEQATDDLGPEPSEPGSGAAPTPEPVASPETTTALPTTTTEEPSTTAVETTAEPATRTPAEADPAETTVVVTTGSPETTLAVVTTTATGTASDSSDGSTGGITDSIPAEIGGFGAGSVFALALLLALTVLLLYANRRRRG